MEQILNPFVVDRLTEVYSRDKDYRSRLEEEDLIFRKLLEELPDGQAEDLKRYFDAVSSTAARKETLTYIQGMKDMFALIKILS